jgi:hypothetical protein
LMGLDDRGVPPREETEANFRALIRRGTNVLVLHTAGLLDEYNYRRQFQDAFPSLELGERLQLEYFPGSDHTATLLACQTAVVERIERFIVEGDWSEAPAHAREAVRVEESAEEPSLVRAIAS